MPLLGLGGDPDAKVIQSAWPAAGVIEGEDLQNVPSFYREDVALDLNAAHTSSMLVHNLSIVLAGPNDGADTVYRWLCREIKLLPDGSETS